MRSPCSSDQHISEEVLEAYSAGWMPEEECALFEEHLLVCAHCQTRLTETEEYLYAGRQAALELRRAARRCGSGRGERHFWPLAVAGLAACAIAVILPWRGNQHRPVLDVNLAVERGAGPQSIVRAPAGQPLALNIDLTEVQRAPLYRLEVVNAAGVPVWAGLLKRDNGSLRVELPITLAPGIYWVRLYAPAPTPQLLREYGLQVS